MGRKAGHEHLVAAGVVNHGSERVHGPGMIALLSRHRQAVLVDMIRLRRIGWIQASPCRADRVKDQRAVHPVAAVRIAAEQDQPPAFGIETGASMPLPAKADFVVGLLLVHLVPLIRFESGQFGIPPRLARGR